MNSLVSVWNEVSQKYTSEIDEGEKQLGSEILKIFNSLEIDTPGELMELGCGSGHLSAYLAQHGFQTHLFDFSPVALEKAKECYKSLNLQGEFVEGNLLDIQPDDHTYDIVWNSGVMEHFNDTTLTKIFNDIKQFNSKYYVFIMPNAHSLPYLLFRYKKMAENQWIWGTEYLRDDYETFFEQCGYELLSTEYIGLNVSDFQLSYALSDSDWDFPLEMLKDFNIISKTNSYLVAYVLKKGTENSTMDSLTENKEKKSSSTSNSVIEYKTKLFDLMAENQHLSIQSKKLEAELLQIQNTQPVEHPLSDELLAKLDSTKQELQKNMEQVTSLQKQLNEKNNHVDSLQKQLEQLNLQLKLATEEKERAQQEIVNIKRSNLWKFAMKYYHVRDRVIPKRILMKKNVASHTTPSVVQDSALSINEKVSLPAKQEKKIDLKINSFDYKKQDFILLSVIDWDFRFQRPQHLSQNLARLGHRTFYFNANFHKNQIRVKDLTANLQEVTLSNFFGTRIYDIDYDSNVKQMQEEISNFLHNYNIRDCTVIVEYPNWVPVANYLKEAFGFKVVFDYIDDYNDFQDTANNKLAGYTEKLFQISDLVIATSQNLYEKALPYSKKIEIVRNGTEFKFFNQAFKPSRTKTKKIGYYGAIAEWFDWEKIDYLAEKLPDVEIELIGNVSYEECYNLKKHANVHFLGEKNYKDLPKHLETYDVCLIPFKSDIELIKATNPVKFYEYLSAGKKIVATEIPELEMYKDDYVYLANSDEQFYNYVLQCLNDEDSLKTADELLNMAQQNDWESRCTELEQHIQGIFPKVSVVLITYNNLNYTKICIDSILAKTAYPNYELIIVDNKSQDDTPSYLQDLQKRHDHIRIILNDDNLGFAAGNNVGMKNASGDYIILLNNDTLVTRGWITGLIKHLDKDNLGMIGPVTNSIGNEAQIEVDYTSTDQMDLFAIDYTTRHHNQTYTAIPVLAMFCVAFKAELIKEVGYLDENYGVGMFEDDDYSIAVKRAGYSIACAEDVFIHHFGSVSFKKLEDSNYKRIFDQNKAYFENKWNTIWLPHNYRA